MKAQVGSFNQEKALVGAFSVIVQLHRLIDLPHYQISNMYLWSKLQWCSALSFRLQAANCLGHLMLESPDLWQDLERFPRCFTLQRHNRFQHHDHHMIYICGILLFTYTLHSYLLFYVFFNIYFVFKSQRHSLRVCVFISQEKISTLPQACKALL